MQIDAATPVILAVDDCPEHLASLERMLQGHPVEFVVAPDPVTAIVVAEERRPQLVLMDFVLPGMDGVECAKRIHKLHDLDETPVVFMVEPGDRERFEQATRPSFYDSLIKPVLPGELSAKLALHLAHVRQLAALKEANAMIRSQQEDMREMHERITEKDEALETLSKQLACYVFPKTGPDQLNTLNRHRVRRRKVTIFFSDICGFTEISDHLEPETLISFINEYFDEMVKIALRHGATIDKFMGDAFMAFFGDPKSIGYKEDATACANMALDMRNKVEELRVKWDGEGFIRPLETRMGIHTGYCTVGNFGSHDRMDYTIIGGPVNLASRLESLSKPSSILISHATYSLLADNFHCSPREALHVKGIKEPIRCYTLEGKNENLHGEQVLLKDALRSALETLPPSASTKSLREALHHIKQSSKT